MNIRPFIPPILISLYRQLRVRAENNYPIGKYVLEIPPGFALPGFQKTYRLYDRFLPVLAKHLDSNKTIIDVGANIGDTTVALVQCCSNPIISIEPSDFFFSYLKKNIIPLSSVDSTRITPIQKLIGTGLISGDLTHTQSGTASLNVSDLSDLPTHTPLDEIIKEEEKVILLKVDTDGFDFDVIQSAEKILSHSEPVLFWENEISQDFQMDGFNELYEFLENHGYTHLYIFDNFGNLILEETSFSALKNINAYLYSMEKNNCTRTFNYTDILATTEKNYTLVKNAIDEYKREWINSLK